MDAGEQLVGVSSYFHAILRLVLVSAHFPGLPDLLVLELPSDSPLRIPFVYGGVCIIDVYHHI